MGEEPDQRDRPDPPGEVRRVGGADDLGADVPGQLPDGRRHSGTPLTSFLDLDIGRSGTNTKLRPDHD
ncbi:hypothetical protein [Streptomyces lydicus]|uniref:hypothetical protein n=1 Tax=Streptomyces lydicus TaxID=47763 RepID=UPI0037A7529C